MSVLPYPFIRCLRTRAAAGVEVERGIGTVNERLERIRNLPRCHNLRNIQEPVPLPVHGFEEEQSVLIQTISNTDQRVFQNESTEFGFGAAFLRMEMKTHSCFPPQNDL